LFAMRRKPSGSIRARGSPHGSPDSTLDVPAILNPIR
jgi:hypothetical protein